LGEVPHRLDAAVRPALGEADEQHQDQRRRVQQSYPTQSKFVIP
jgi:hypothetical protein